MAVTIDSVIRVGRHSWRVGWSSDPAGAVFRVFRNGRALGVTRATSMVFTSRPGSWPVIEVLDSADAPRRTAEPEAIVQWEAVAGAAGYRVEQLIDAVWVGLTTVDDDGSATYRVTTNPLEDATEYQFRVIPLGADGNEGTPAAITVEAVRHPDPPHVGYAFDDSMKTVTIEAA